MKCILCNKELKPINKSGYCTKCYCHSPFYKSYQARKQKEWYAKPENKKKRKDYKNILRVKAHLKKYQRKYQKQHIERMRELKRNWARKNRLKIL